MQAAGGVRILSAHVAANFIFRPSPFIRDSMYHGGKSYFPFLFPPSILLLDDNLEA